MIEGDRVTVRLALDAMATRFELVLLGRDATRLRASGEEALREIKSLERRFSFYNPSSELCAINRGAARSPVRVAPDLFDLLVHCFALANTTRGTFDPTVGPLMRSWGFYLGTGKRPNEKQLSSAREISGRHHVELDVAHQSISFDREGVEIDLGGIAKGYAIDEAGRILSEAGIEDALLHGGTSSVLGMGISYDGKPWRVAIGDEGILLGTVELENATVSVSATSGKSFEDDGLRRGHVMDPRTGEPAVGAAVSAVTSNSATESDALSTAALILGIDARALAGNGIGLAAWSKPDIDHLLFCEGLSEFSESLL